MTPRRFSFRQSSALHLGLFLACVFVTANGIAFATAHMLSNRELEAQAKHSILGKVATLVAAFDRGGLTALSDQVRMQAAPNNAGGALFALDLGQPVGQIGNISVQKPFEGWRRMRGADFSEAGTAGVADAYMGFGIRLGKSTLMVAQSVDSLEDLSEIFSRIFLIALSSAAVIALLATWVFVWRAERRIGAIVGTLSSVSRGQYGARIPKIGKGADDLARISAELNAMLAQLQRNMIALKHISADIAHDLKTPLQRLQATLESLQSTDAAPGATTPIIDDAIGQAGAIVRTFQALLMIGQIEGGSPKARFRPVDMREICESVADMYQSAVEEAGDRFCLSLGPEAGHAVLGDRDLLAQMLANLIENAMRHAPAPVVIGLALSGTPGTTVIEITDDGPGIPARERERVFERFYRLERSRTSEGSGLGLALVAVVVDLHGGTITLSDNAPGLRVTVTLPQRAPSGVPL